MGRPFDIEAAPQTPEELRQWLRCALDVDPPQRPIEPGSATPWDYLCWTYFEESAPNGKRRIAEAPHEAGSRESDPERSKQSSAGHGGQALKSGERRIAEAPHEAGPKESDPERSKQSSAGHGGQARQTDCVVWAPRGGGKTFYAAVATLLDLAFKPGIEVKILGGSLDQSLRMHEHLRRLFERPGLDHLLAAPITRRRCTLINGSTAEVLAQSHTSVRGTRPQKLRCDEVELFDPEIWRAAQLVTRSKWCPAPSSSGSPLTAHASPLFVRGSVEALSTLHKPGGLMAQIVSRATDPSAGQCGSGPPSSPSVPLCLRASVPSPVLFRWSILDVLEHCPAERSCGECALYESCQGRAKEHRGGNGGGHVFIDDALTMLARSDRASWESEMLCLRPRHSAAVLPEFDPGVHVITEDFFTTENTESTEMDGVQDSGFRIRGSEHPTSHIRLPTLPQDPRPQTQDPRRPLWAAGMDFGFRSPSVILLACVDESGVVRIVAESVQSGVLLASQIELLKTGLLNSSEPKTPDPRPKTLPIPFWIGVDPAGGQRSEQTGMSNITMMRRAGLVVRDRRAPIEAGLNAIRARLAPASGGGPTLFISRRCPRLIEALQTYHYNEDRPADPHPVKDGPDHLVDALRYLIVNLDFPYRASAGAYW